MHPWSTPPAPMGSVWIHAASVGEVAAAEVLWRALSGPRFLTTDTDSGLERARLFTPTSSRRPWDVPGAVEPLLAQARPRALVFVEGTYWPWLAHRAARAGVPVLRVSCKVGTRTRRVPRPVLRRLWGATTAVAARDHGEGRFLAAVHDAPVSVVGDLKGGIRPAASPLRWARPFVVGASVWPDEVLPVVRGWQAGAQGHALLLAPRHPQRLDPARWLDPLGLRWVRRSDLRDGAVPSEVDVVWLDTLGELGRCLEGARAVFVGGTFDPAVGGHAADESLAWGVPVLAGPARHNNRASLATAALVPAPSDLGRVWSQTLEMPVPRPRRDDQVGERVAAFVRRHQGLPCPEQPPRPWARPFVPVWRLVHQADVLRRRLRPSVRVSVPVISIGSANARSPGRTSTVMWLADHLRAAGHQVGVALRGYKRRERGLETSWTGGSSAARLGDEGHMLAQAGHMVAAAARRGDAVEALATHGCSVVLLDDGRQCTEVARDLDVEVIDGRYPSARGMLPAGERRTDVWGDTEVCLVHHADAWPERPAGHIAVRRRAGPWHQGGRAAPAGPDGPVAVWLGVGHPEEVLEALRVPIAAQRIDADHALPPTDLADWLAGRPLVCTDKDRARLPTPLAEVAWTRPMELTVDDLRWLAPYLDVPA